MTNTQVRRILVGVALGPRADPHHRRQPAGHRRGHAPGEGHGSRAGVHALAVGRRVLRPAHQLRQHRQPRRDQPGHGRPSRGLVQKAHDEGLEATLELSEDRPLLALTRRVLRDGIDLVIVGKRDEFDRDERRLGSVAAKLLRKCPGRVWAVGEKHEPTAADRGRHGLLGGGHGRRGERAGPGARARRGPARGARLPDPLRDGARVRSDPRGRAPEAPGLAAREGRVDPERAARSPAPGGRDRPHPRGVLLAERARARDDPANRRGTAGPGHGLERAAFAACWSGTRPSAWLDRVDCSLLAVKPEDFVSPISLD